MNEQIIHTLEKTLSRSGPFRKKVNLWVATASRAVGGENVWKSPWYMDAYTTGAAMEDTVELMSAVTDNLSKARAVLEKTSEDVRTVFDTVIPLLAQDVQKLRDVRMAVGREVAQVAGAYRELMPLVESSEKIERFLGVARQLVELGRDPALRAFLVAHDDDAGQ